MRLGLYRVDITNAKASIFACTKCYESTLNEVKNRGYSYKTYRIIRSRITNPLVCQICNRIFNKTERVEFRGEARNSYLSDTPATFEQIEAIINETISYLKSKGFTFRAFGYNGVVLEGRSVKRKHAYVSMGQVHVYPNGLNVGTAIHETCHLFKGGEGHRRSFRVMHRLVLDYWESIIKKEVA